MNYMTIEIKDLITNWGINFFGNCMANQDAPEEVKAAFAARGDEIRSLLRNEVATKARAWAQASDELVEWAYRLPGYRLQEVVQEAFQEVTGDDTVFLDRELLAGKVEPRWCAYGVQEDATKAQELYVSVLTRYPFAWAARWCMAAVFHGDEELNMAAGFTVSAIFPGIDLAQGMEGVAALSDLQAAYYAGDAAAPARIIKRLMDKGVRLYYRTNTYTGHTRARWRRFVNG